MILRGLIYLIVSSVGVQLFSCKKANNGNLSLQEVEIAFLEKAATHVISIEKGTNIISLDSIIICNEFDFFSIKRFAKSLEDEIKLPDGLEQKINLKYFGKISNQINNLTSSEKSSKILSFSGFFDGYIIITYRELGEKVNNTFCRVADLESTHEKVYLLQARNDKFFVIAKSEVTYN